MTDESSRPSLTRPLDWVGSITVVCAEQSHKAVPWIVGEWHQLRDEHGVEMWMPMRHVLDRGTPAGSKRMVDYDPLAMLYDDEFVAHDVAADLVRVLGPDDAKTAHFRWKFQCRRCGLDFESRDDGRVEALFDRLSAAGITEISLSALGARLH